MFSKEGIPFFSIIMPFLSILFISFFTTSFYLKLSDENFYADIKIYEKNNTINKHTNDVGLFIEQKRIQKELQDDKFINFVIVITTLLLLFMATFSYMMSSIIDGVIKRYKEEVKQKKEKLQMLNKTLAHKVKDGIEEATRKDKAILIQSRLARMGSMISMIAHQWRQPLTELSGILMELETATKFKKINEEHIFKSIRKSDKMIEYMSSTIDDFRNFYKPDKKKEDFFALDSCIKAINLAKASLKDSSIDLILFVNTDKVIHGYPTEYAQVILNLISNARDVLVEKRVHKPKIHILIDVQEDKSIVEIKDNAGGIKNEDFDLIFDPYFSTKDSSKGTGLGLYISKLIIEKNMKGELNVHNDNNGAVFTVYVE
ncbi:HAMP domain-containing sensor histidine kinase [Sulfurimonas sp.]|uniref:sensor histidine kinase n=1 Tax=Sulfurimonas sp. TaxID=2022749 RepID=UPI0025D3196C|nr:HAMP domain-containing sensor histidine kinase [Sulfurimonas sp.]